MRTRLLAAIGCLAFAVPAHAAPKVMIWGQGTNSCGRWLEERKKDSLESATLTVWVVGFLTAYNVYVAPSGDVLEGTDVDGAVAWIDNYCTAHPLETVASASEALVRALAPKRR